MSYLVKNFLYRYVLTPNETAISMGIGKRKVRITIQTMPMDLVFENISARDDPTIRQEITGKDDIIC
jgi:hypothetical protein